MSFDSDLILRDIFKQTRVIALVGASLKPDRASHRVGAFLVERGYRVIPINPGHAGKMLWGETIRSSLADCPKDVGMVDIFRKSSDVPPVVEAALAHLPNLQVIWMQLGITHEGAADLGRGAGKTVIMDRCPKIDYPRLFGGALRTELV